MTTAVKRTRGAPPENRNAGIPDCYHALTPKGQKTFRKLSRSHGYEPEITGLSQALRSMLSKDTPDYRLIKQGYRSLAFFIRQQLLLDRDDSRRLVKTAKDILRDMSVLVRTLPSPSSKRGSPEPG